MTHSVLKRAAKRVGADGLLAAIPDAHWSAVQRHWPLWARPEQLPPPLPWRTWIALAGRGWGKSRCGAEWVRSLALAHPGCHIALVAPTAADARDVMVKALITPWKGGELAEVPNFEVSKRRVTWANGSTATVYSADEPERLRGPQHHFAWADEFCAWRYAGEAWTQLQFGLRLGDNARALVTTTPKPTHELRALLKQPTTVRTGGSTFENADNLDASSVAEMKRAFDGTRLGRQELYAEVLEKVEGALWDLERIDALRRHAPELRRIVVAIDPSGSAKQTADEAGIVVAGVGDCACLGRVEQHGFVLEDLTGRFSPADMAKTAIGAYHKYKADKLVAEDNFGGVMVKDLVHLTDPRVAYRRVHASRGKIVRAEPVAALYEQGRVHHVGAHAKLEDEMCTYAPLISTESPGRLDALVWALTDLMLGEGRASFAALQDVSAGRRI